MYHPYLFGRAAELDAVAAASDDFGTPQQIVPIIEPVMKPDGDLSRYVRKLTNTLNALGRNGAVAYVVVNPHQGGFSRAANVARWTMSMAGPLADPKLVRPTLKVLASTTLADLTAFLSTYRGRDVALVVADERPLSATQIATAVGSANAQLFLLAGVDPAPFSAAFPASRVLRVMDNFPAQARNADYSGAELLANNHLAYPATSPGGFSDFTVLPGTLRLGGGRTGAAVVHLTYKVSGGPFWVEHFVSDETDVAIGTFQTKLLEALVHMDTAMTANPTKFEPSSAVLEYRDQHRTGRVTSQGKNKELQVRHHLYAVARHLGI